MTRISLRALLVALLCVWAMGCERPITYQPAKFNRGELQTIDTVPVVSLVGSATEIGGQEAALVGTHARTLLGFGPKLLGHVGGAGAWERHVKLSRDLMARVPSDYREEIVAFAKSSGCSIDDMTGSQTLYDTLPTFGCSSLIVPSSRSATDGPLFGRNLDYASFGLLHRYGMVKTYRPTGKYAFASIGFPGCMGVVSGMNERGLALALHEIRRSGDDSPRFDRAGWPTMLLLRHVLEECETVEEARTLIDSLPRCTMFNLAVCDRDGGGVLEISVKNVAFRASDDLCACTNHFCTSELRCNADSCWRMEKLLKAPPEKFAVAQVFSRLGDVNQGQQTFQSMVFEPRARVVHVSIDHRPSTEGTLRMIELDRLWKTGE